MDLEAAPVDGDSWLTGTLIDLVCMHIQRNYPAVHVLPCTFAAFEAESACRTETNLQEYQPTDLLGRRVDVRSIFQRGEGARAPGASSKGSWNQPGMEDSIGRDDGGSAAAAAAAAAGRNPRALDGLPGKFRVELCCRPVVYRRRLRASKGGPRAGSRKATKVLAPKPRSPRKRQRDGMAAAGRAPGSPSTSAAMHHMQRNGTAPSPSAALQPPSEPSPVTADDLLQYFTRLCMGRAVPPAWSPPCRSVALLFIDGVAAAHPDGPQKQCAALAARAALCDPASRWMQERMDELTSAGTQEINRL